MAHEEWVRNLQTVNDVDDLNQMTHLGNMLCDSTYECNEAVHCFVMDLVAMSTTRTVTHSFMTGNFLFKLYNMKEAAFYSSFTSMIKVHKIMGIDTT